MYGIMRVEKRKMQAVKGIADENNRTKNDKDKGRFQNSKIDYDKTDNNVVLVQAPDVPQSIKEAISKAGITKYRKDAITCLDAVYTASPEFFKNKTTEDITQYFKDCLQFHKQEYGDYVVNAVIHYDEDTPHMHVMSVPLTEREDGSLKLCAKEIMGNKSLYNKHQTHFFEEVGQGYGLERGQEHTGAKHKTALQHSIEVLQQELTDIQDDITKAIDGRDKAYKELEDAIDELTKVIKRSFKKDRQRGGWTYNGEYVKNVESVRDDIRQMLNEMSKTDVNIQVEYDKAVEMRNKAKQTLEEAQAIRDQIEQDKANIDALATDKALAMLEDKFNEGEGDRFDRLHALASRVELSDGYTLADKFDDMEQELINDMATRIDGIER